VTSVGDGTAQDLGHFGSFHQTDCVLLVSSGSFFLVVFEGNISLEYGGQWV